MPEAVAMCHLAGSPHLECSEQSQCMPCRVNHCLCQTNSGFCCISLQKQPNHLLACILNNQPIGLKLLYMHFQMTLTMSEYGCPAKLMSDPRSPRHYRVTVEPSDECDSIVFVSKTATCAVLEITSLERMDDSTEADIISNEPFWKQTKSCAAWLEAIAFC